MIKDKIEIFLITYNRASKLEKTFKQLFAANSPIKDFDITILDNNSTDNTVEVIKKYQKNFKNLKHLRQKRNIGANANIARAYEEATKDYVWILADDDNYDFSSWSEVEQAIKRKEEIIMVSKYALPETYNLINIITQASFTPSVILSTKLLDDTTLRNMYDNIYTMYVQLVPIVMALNENKQIYVLNGKAIILNGNDYGVQCGLFCHSVNYHRGADADRMWYRSATMTQIIGIINALEPLKNGSKEIFMDRNINSAIHFFKPFSKDFMHFADIWVNFNRKQKIKFLKKLIIIKLHIPTIITFKKNSKGIYVTLFNVLKFKIIPFRKKK